MNFINISLWKDDFKAIVQPDQSKEVYYVRYMIEEFEDEEEKRTRVKCRETMTLQKPNLYFLRKITEDALNEQCESKILSGYAVDNATVWLTEANQSNYASAVQCGIAPFTVKLGDSSAPVYKTFDTAKDVKAFWKGCIEHIQSCLAECWEKKKSIDYSIYGLNEAES